jgi:hypothetical protein
MCVAVSTVAAANGHSKSICVKNITVPQVGRLFVLQRERLVRNLIGDGQHLVLARSEGEQNCETAHAKTTNSVYARLLEARGGVCSVVRTTVAIVGGGSNTNKETQRSNETMISMF